MHWTIVSHSTREGVKGVFYTCVDDSTAKSLVFHEDEVLARVFMGDVFETEGGKKVHYLVKSGRSVDSSENDNLADVVKTPSAGILPILAENARQDASLSRLEALRHELRDWFAGQDL